MSRVKGKPSLPLKGNNKLNFRLARDQVKYPGIAAWCRGTLMVSGKQKSLFPLEPFIKCLLFTVTVLVFTF